MVNSTKNHKWELPTTNFPHFADYRCRICDSKSGPFFDDTFGKKGIDFLCIMCEDEVVEVRKDWALEDYLNGDKND